LTHPTQFSVSHIPPCCWSVFLCQQLITPPRWSPVNFDLKRTLLHPCAFSRDLCLTFSKHLLYSDIYGSAGHANTENVACLRFHLISCEWLPAVQRAT
jgi:hypothetical protein